MPAVMAVIIATISLLALAFVFDLPILAAVTGLDRASAEAARQRGLAVVLVLRVALDHAFHRNKFFWHGMIQPRTEAELSDWFWRYRKFTAKWAAIAEAEGMDNGAPE